MNKSIRKVILSLAIATTTLIGGLSTTVFAAQTASTSISEKSDITYSGKNATLDNKIDKIASQIRDYKTKNPKATDKALNDYANSLLNSNQTSISDKTLTVSSVYTDLDGYINGYLNSQEQQLYNNNRAKGILCMANGKLALQYAQSNYANTEAVQHNGNGDAFRHALWNYGMAVDVGSSFAKQWSNAHENGTSNNPALEKQMDLFNNGVGLYQYSLNSNPGSISKMISIIKKRVDVGGCEIIRNGRIVNSDTVGKN